jgi:hypothetical protein
MKSMFLVLLLAAVALCSVYSRVGSGYKSRVQQDVFVIPDRVSFEVGDRAARLFKNAVRCGCVPLHGGAVARINIGSTLSNETKL